MKNTKGTVFRAGRSYYTVGGRVVDVVAVADGVVGYVNYESGRKCKMWAGDGRSAPTKRTKLDLTLAEVTRPRLAKPTEPAAIAEVQFGTAAQLVKALELPNIVGSPLYNNDADEDLVPAKVTKLPYRVKFTAELVSNSPAREFYSPLFDSEAYARTWSERKGHNIIAVRRVEVY